MGAVLLASGRCGQMLDTRAWYIFEGPTHPDAIIETPDALIVIEGNQTEAGPTTSTTWMPCRHQIWRHIDAAWEIRGALRVFGLFIVESERGLEVPKVWSDAVDQSQSERVLDGSFPHRGNAERAARAACLIGVTTLAASSRSLQASAVDAARDCDVGRLESLVGSRHGVTPFRGTFSGCNCHTTVNIPKGC